MQISKGTLYLRETGMLLIIGEEHIRSSNPYKKSVTIKSFL